MGAEVANKLVYLPFLSWLWLTIIAVVISVVWYFVLKVRSAGGFWVQLIAAWIGAWLGTPVFGNWGFLTVNYICIIPAILGSVAGVMLCAGYDKVLKAAFGRVE